MHWVAWNKMSVPMSDGDLGFSHIESFNEAMLAKQCCRIQKNSESIKTDVKDSKL